VPPSTQRSGQPAEAACSPRERRGPGPPRRPHSSRAAFGVTVPLTPEPAHPRAGGGTGDLSAFAPTAAFLYDVEDFLRDWLRDLAVEQDHNDGIVPIVVPDVVKYFTMPEGMPKPGATAIWGDAAVWVPRALWTAYGDTAVLAEQFDSMTSHARVIAGMLAPSGVWDNGFQFGDWLDPEAPPEEPFRSKADHHVVATLCAYRTARIVADTATILGRDAGEFTALAGRLSELVARSGHRVSTGFAGTPFITAALTRTGHLDDAYGLLTQTECPS